MECDPELCVSCFEHENCRNKAMTLGRAKRTFVAKSMVCGGLGLFAGEDIARGEFVIEYIGQVVLNEENQLNNLFTDVFYSFRLKENWLVDSLTWGNKSRYINHARSVAIENLIAKNVYVQGNIQLGLFAQKPIHFGDELLFNYDGDETLHQIFDWIQPRPGRRRPSLGAAEGAEQPNDAIEIEK